VPNDNSLFMLLFSVLVECVKVHVLKPTTSKPGNSEVYVVAECFKSLDEQWLSVLNSHIGW